MVSLPDANKRTALIVIIAAATLIVSAVRTTAQQPGPRLQLDIPPAPAARLPERIAALPETAGGTIRVERADQSYLGVASCASTSCHGGTVEEHGLLSSALTMWSQSDPHARAAEVLYSEASARMVEALDLPESAWESRTCTVCHAPAAAATTGRSASLLRSEGVGCEACHGPAEHWLEPHRSYVWNRSDVWSSERKAAAGFRETKNLSVRASVCADCHVGAADREVNHDLIAAGHPRLAFEFSAYHAMLPAHWRRPVDRSRVAAAAGSEPSTFEARAWTVGQLVTAEKELELLAARAERADAPWPEFSEYGCFACHQKLRSTEFSLQTHDGLHPGALPWATWNLALTDLLLADAGLDAQPVQHELNQLRRAMSHPVPDRELVARQSHSLRGRLAALSNEVRRQRLTQSSARQILAVLLDDRDRLTRRSWDSAAQLYLATAALQQSAIEDSGLTGVDHLAEARRILSFEPITAEAERAPHRVYNSPHAFEQDDVEALIDTYDAIERLIAR